MCLTCWNSVRANKVPVYSISNNFIINEIPDALKDLSVPEMMIITPVRSFFSILQLKPVKFKT